MQGIEYVGGNGRTEIGPMHLHVSRRQALALGAGALAAAGLGAAPALAKNDSDELIKKFAGGTEPVKGKVKLDVPEIAENGNTVPMTVSVDSPMTEQSYVTDLMVVADANPRIRLAETQNVIAVAKMSDGSVFMDTKLVKVTIGGCGG